MEQPAFQAQFLLKDKNLQTAQSCDMVVEMIHPNPNLIPR